MALKPPVEVPQGAIRLNTDSQKLEFFAQDQWWEMATHEALTGQDKALFAGAYQHPGNTSNVIDYIHISSEGNAVDFGDLLNAQGTGTSFGSVTRAIWAGGWISPGMSNVIQYATIPTQGNAIDFGDMTYSAGHGLGGCSNQVRGLNAGGNPQTNTINYVTIASTGNATDFGDMTNARYGLAGVSSPTRGVFSNGDLGPAYTNVIDYVTIASTGNAVDFGDSAMGNSSGNGGASNSIRGLFCGGSGPSSSGGNFLDYITIATTGNAAEFGDGLIDENNRFPGGAASPTRAVWVGGYTSSQRNHIASNMIATLGNSIEFGELTGSYSQHFGTSNCHGGLG